MFWKKYKVVNKKRFTIFIISMLSIIFLMTSLIFKSIKSYGSESNTYFIVTIDEGDTLWDVAKKTTPNNYDIRKVIHEIQVINDKEDSVVYPGETLKVPNLN